MSLKANNPRISFSSVKKKDALSRFSGDSAQIIPRLFPARHHRREPQERGALQSVHGKFPDNRYKEQLRSGIHRLLYRPAPLFHRGVPRTRPDLQRPAQGETETLLYGLGTRGLRHGGTGCLFRYHPLHDAARHSSSTVPRGSSYRSYTVRRAYSSGRAYTPTAPNSTPPESFRSRGRG